VYEKNMLHFKTNVYWAVCKRTVCLSTMLDEHMVRTQLSLSLWEFATHVLIQPNAFAENA